MEYICQECGYRTVKWFGQCPSCQAWNTAVEEKGAARRRYKTKTSLPTVRLASLDEPEIPRLNTGFGELDRTLGGGVLAGSVILLAGEPGVGKSTLLLQVADRMSAKNPVLYISGEESASQLASRFRRLHLNSQQLYVSSETEIEEVVSEILKAQPVCAMVDSVQTLWDSQLDGALGSILQLRECCAKLIRLAKEESIPLFLVGHITKEGSVAGPKALEHMVDTVLYFEGERTFSYRVLRATKNRFGPVDEIGVFQMAERGLEEVLNPSFLLSETDQPPPAGSIATCIIEGSRPFLVEVQALVSRPVWGTPRRLCTGIDPNRVSLALAVLEKKANIDLSGADVFVNVVGGIKVSDRAADLAIALSLASSWRNVPPSRRTLALGEIGLGGEIRPVKQLHPRLREAQRLGLEHLLVPDQREKPFDSPSAVRVSSVKWVEEAVRTTLAPSTSERR